MKQTITYLFIVLCLYSGTQGLAQADINQSTQGYNRANYNPASIARPGYLYLFSNVRQQWVGLAGAPHTINVEVSQYFPALRAAFGLSLVTDHIGAVESFNPMLAYAYRINSKSDWSISLGLSAGLFSRSVRGSNFEAVTTIDPAIQYDLQRVMKPDANVGFEFQNTHFVVSVSSTHLFSIRKSDSLLLNTNHRYASVIYQNTHLGYLNYYIGLQAVNRQNLTVMEGTVILRFKHPTGLLGGPRDLFDVGLTLGTSRQISWLFGVNVIPDLRVGYSYNQSFIRGYYGNGSHEIMFECRIRPGSTSKRPPRLQQPYRPQ